MSKSFELENYMNNFTGTEAYHQYFGILLIDGVVGFVKKAEAFWFLDLVRPVLLSREDCFVSIKMVVKDGKATITMTGDEEKVFYEKRIAYTDYPEGEWIFFYQNGVLMYCREY